MNVPHFFLGALVDFVAGLGAAVAGAAGFAAAVAGLGAG
jgi:hypothetical protein